MAKKDIDCVMDGAKGAKGRTGKENAPQVTEGIDYNAPGEIESWKVSDLREHPENKRLFNPLTGSDFERLKADIEKNGMHDALIVTPTGADGKRTILAGHNRYKAALELEKERVPVRVKVFKNKADETRFIVRDNLLRRQLTRGEKAAFIAKLYPEAMDKDDKGGRPGNPDTVSGLLPQTLTEVSNETGLSDRQLRRIKQTHKTAKKLAGGKTPTIKHYDKAAEIHAGARRKATQTAQEAPQRTQKGGAGERVGGGKDAGGRLDTLAAAFIAEARSVRGLTFADIDKAVETIREALYGRIEGK